MIGGRISWLMYVGIVLIITAIIAKRRKDAYIIQKLYALFFLLIGTTILGIFLNFIELIQLSSFISLIFLELIIIIEYMLLANKLRKIIPKIFRLE